MARWSLRRRVFEALWSAPVRAVVGRVRYARRLYVGWRRMHPFDHVHGVDTSGAAAASGVPNAEIASRRQPYGGSQPSIIRAAVAALPDHARYAFVDLGCGKGRPLVVASEFPFRRILGVEISPVLAQIGRRNAAVIAARYPDRPPIAIEEGDATLVAPPSDRVVYFMYHPFGRSLVGDLIANIERQLVHGLEHAFFLYYNPVHGEALDRSPHFTRWWAATLPYADDELGFGPDLNDTLVIWQTRPPQYPAQRGAARPIVVHQSGARAGLGSHTHTAAMDYGHDGAGNPPAHEAHTLD